MNLKRQRSLLTREIQAASYLAIFVQVKTHHPALDRYDTIEELLKTLCSYSRLFTEKELLVQAILLEHGKRPQPLWTALLLLACYPMLSRLRRRLNREPMPGEYDQLIISSFLEVVADVSARPVRDRMFMRLRQATHRLVFRRMRHEQRVWERVRPVPMEELQMFEEKCLDEHRPVSWPEVRPRRRTLRTPDEREEQREFLERHAAAVLAPEKLEPVMATLVHGEPLRRFVERTYPDAKGDEQRRLYQRIKRRHSRAMQELRKLFSQHRLESIGASASPVR